MEGVPRKRRRLLEAVKEDATEQSRYKVSKPRRSKFNLNTVDSSNMSAELSIDVLAVVAEHLIGQHAFGTTANLNVASWELYHATLPILYETVILNARRSLAWYICQPPPLKYTKFVLLEVEDPPYFKLPERMPKVVMSVLASFNPFETGACYVKLYRPVSTATAITILATPIAHWPTVDHLCMNEVEQDNLVASDVPVDTCLTIARGLDKRCGRMRRKPVIRPSEAIRKLLLEPGAYLHSDPPSHLRHTTTSLLLHRTQVKRAQRGPNVSTAMIDTASELLKLATRHPDPAYLKNAAALEVWRDEQRRSDGRCRYSRSWVKWNLELQLYASEAEAFIKRLGTAIRQTPEMLQNRMLIEIIGPVPAGLVEAITRQLGEVYESIRSSDHLEPRTIRGVKNAVARCEAQTILDFQPVSPSAPRVQSEYGNIAVAQSDVPADRPAFVYTFGTSQL